MHTIFCPSVYGLVRALDMHQIHDVCHVDLLGHYFSRPVQDSLQEHST